MERSQCNEITVSDSHANGQMKEKDKGTKGSYNYSFSFLFHDTHFCSANARTVCTKIIIPLFETEKNFFIFLDTLLELSEGDGGLCDQDIRDEVDAFMFGVSLEA